MSWKTVALGDVCELYQPQTITTKDLIDDGKYPVYGANGVIGRYDKYNHEESQLLVTCRGATCGSVNITEPFSWINGNAMVVKPKIQEIDVRFIEYFFRGAVDLTKAITGAAQPQITRQSLSPITFSYPPISTQQKIVAKLDAIFAEIDKAQAAAEANAKNAEALFQSYLNEVFERGGEDWNTYTFDEIVEDKQIGLVKNSKEQLEDGEFAYFKMNNILNNNKCDLRILARVNATKEDLTKFRLVKNDFLFNTRNSTELVGKVCVFEGEERDNILYNNNIMRVRFKPFVSSKFIHQAFSYKKIKAELEKLKTGTTNVAAIYYKDLKNLKLSIPSITQQNSILISLEKLDAITEGIKKQRQQKINELYKLKQSILRQAFAGELVKE